MVEAAYRLFCERGYVATTMEEIAREAGVAVQTVYFTFHNKVALLKEAFDASVLTHDDPAPPDARAWYAEFERERDGPKAIGILVDNVSEILRRVAPLAAAMTAAAGDPVAADMYAKGEALRRDGYARIVAITAKKQVLRRGLTETRAVDILFTLLSPEMFQAMSRCGWTFTEYKSWMADLLVQQLLRA
jgi:AcrR family transcriptional regulator